MNARERFKKLIDCNGLFILPGVYDALMARVVEDIGFKAVYITGAGVTNTQLGLPDLSVISYYEIFYQTMKIISAVDIPVVVDIDTGFGGEVNLIRTIKEMERIGVAALQLEDQVFPKRSGHFEGKQVISKEEMVDKIKIAIDSRNDTNLQIIARTDAITIEGFDKAIDRAQSYYEAGADIIFVEAPQNEEQLKRIPALIKAPLLVNIVEGGKTPLKTKEELDAMGYSIMLNANSTLRGAVKGAQIVLTHLHSKGTTKDILDKIITFEERNRLTRANDMFKEGELFK